MAIMEVASAMSSWQTVGTAHNAFGAQKQCLVLFGVHPQRFGLWELRQGSLRNTDGYGSSTNSVKLISLLYGENWHIFKP